MDLHRIPQLRILSEHLGSDYGGWNICPTRLRSTSIVYSIGVGEDISFDLELIAKYGVEVFAFDPTPRSIEFIQRQSPPCQIRFYPFGLAHFNGFAQFYAPKNPAHVSHTLLKRPTDRTIEVPVFRLRTIMDKLGHDHIDLLKMDIEGAEYLVIEDIIESNILIQQLVLEFHHAFDGIGLSKTIQAIKVLNRKGFKTFFISPNGNEFSFMCNLIPFT